MSEADGPATEALRELMAAFGRSLTAEGFCGNCHAWTSQPRPAG